MRPIVTIAAVVGLAACPSPTPPDADVEATLQISSPAFDDGAVIPELHTCEGDDTPPPLVWSGEPDATVTFAVILTDLDAPGETFTHWLVAGIPGASEGLPDGAVPAGAVVGTNQFGEVDYGGPCPPSDDDPHQYVFAVYALSDTSDLEDGFSAAALDEVLDEHALARGTLSGYYDR